jgi:hypothetical protein
MTTPYAVRIRRVALASGLAVGALLVAAPAHADPTSWSGPNAHCVYSVEAPAWCSGTSAPAQAASGRVGAP